MSEVEVVGYLDLEDGFLNKHNHKGYTEAVVLLSDYEELLSKYQELVRTGWSMSNCCYNLSQNEGNELQKNWCDSMKNAYLEWDGVLNKHREC